MRHGLSQRPFNIQQWAVLFIRGVDAASTALAFFPASSFQPDNG